MTQNYNKYDLELLTPEAVPAPSPLAVRVVSSTKGFDDLGEVWKDLHNEAGLWVFQSFEWLRAWWRQFGESNPSATLHILVCTSAEETIAIAPLFVERVFVLGIPVFHRLRFIGCETSDYLDILVKTGWERQCAEVIASYCFANRNLFQVVQFEDSPDRSRVHRLLYEALAAAGFRGQRFINDACPRTELRSTWEATMELIPGDHRRELKRRRRLLTERHQVQYEISPPESALSDLVEFIGMHQRRWESVGQRGLFADPRVVRFQKEVASQFARRGWLVLSFLRVDGKRVAVNYGFQFKDELSHYLNGVEDAGEARKYSPGAVLHAYCMEEMIRRGARAYDFLRGTEPYKYELGAVDVPNWSMIMHNDEASLIVVRLRVAVLTRALLRRLAREWGIWNHQRRIHGFFSRKLMQSSRKSIQSVVADGLQKAQAPDKPIGL